MADQVNPILEPEFHDLALKRTALRALADDPAEEVKSFIAERGAGADEEAVVLHRMEASNGKQAERAATSRG